MCRETGEKTKVQRFPGGMVATGSEILSPQTLGKDIEGILRHQLSMTEGEYIKEWGKMEYIHRVRFVQLNDVHSQKSWYYRERIPSVCSRQTQSCTDESKRRISPYSVLLADIDRRKEAGSVNFNGASMRQAPYAQKSKIRSSAAHVGRNANARVKNLCGSSKHIRFYLGLNDGCYARRTAAEGRVKGGPYLVRTTSVIHGESEDAPCNCTCWAKREFAGTERVRLQHSCAETCCRRLLRCWLSTVGWVLDSNERYVHRAVVVYIWGSGSGLSEIIGRDSNNAREERGRRWDLKAHEFSRDDMGLRRRPERLPTPSQHPRVGYAAPAPFGGMIDA
ncbi:hypothetical protein B0H13DRAFT_2275623 [Mycena leptocephala]|nr:hypothetical protein B0H13DRAFT_2275623 [Mycena leptocephala]